MKVDEGQWTEMKVDNGRWKQRKVDEKNVDKEIWG